MVSVKSSKSKPVRLKDHERRRLLTKGVHAFVSDDEESDEGGIGDEGACRRFGGMGRGGRDEDGGCSRGRDRAHGEDGRGRSENVHRNDGEVMLTISTL